MGHSGGSFWLYLNDRQARTGKLMDVASTLNWISSLSGLSPHSSAHQVLVRLEELLAADLAPEERLALLKLVKRPMDKVVAGLSGDDLMAIASNSDTVALTPEQRIYAAMISNLRQLLETIDRGRFGVDANLSKDEARDWTLRNIYKYNARQLQYAIKKGLSWPANTWLGLHSLFDYLISRGQIELSHGLYIGEKNRDEFDPEVAYKRLLLLGLAMRMGGRKAIDSELREQLSTWGRQTQLLEPEMVIGQFSLFLVDTSADAPPTFKPGDLSKSFHGWVLSPPQQFVDHVNRAQFGPFAAPPEPGHFRLS